MKLSEKIKAEIPGSYAPHISVSRYALEEWRVDASQLEQAQTWIPVSERLPETNQGDRIIASSERVLVMCENGTMLVARLERWREDGATNWTAYDSPVTHWMPLPAPPSLHP